MANIVKIKQVYFYSGLTANAADTYATQKLLDDNGIPYTHLHYADASQHAINFAALSTWSFGPDFKQYTFTDFPIVYWTEYYDDYERFLQVATSSAELAASNLITNKSLVQ